MRTRRRLFRAALLACLALACHALVCLAWAAAPAAFAQSKPASQEAYALVAGTVFREPGFLQPGAKVVLALASQPDKKLQEQVSGLRGEFAFRVKPETNRYIVTATLKGFETARKTIEITGQEQTSATLMLIAESNSKGR